MAQLYNYNQTLHDVYNYPPAPTFYIDPSDFSKNVYHYPISYNENFYLKNPIYGITGLDFSGITIRPRGAPTYGFDDLAGRTGYNPLNGIQEYSGLTFGLYNRFTGLTCLYFSSIKFFNPVLFAEQAAFYYPGATLTTGLTLDTNYERGWTLENGSVEWAKDWKNWNQGSPCGILISPRHILITAHFIAGVKNSQATFYFLGKNNQLYAKRALLKIKNTTGGFFNEPVSPSFYPDGYNFPEMDQDIAIYEIIEEDKFTTQELQYVKIYKFINNSTIKNKNTPFYFFLNQGHVVVMGYNVPGYDTTPSHYFDANKFPNASYLGMRLKDGKRYLVQYKTIPNHNIFQSVSSVFWFGDSGTPVFVFNPSINETCIAFLAFGAAGFNSEYENWFPNVYLKWWNALKQYINDTCPGFSFNWVSYANTPSSKPEFPITITDPEDKEKYIAKYVLTYEQTLGIGSLNINGYLQPGKTYSFALVSRGKGKIISDPVFLKDIYFGKGYTMKF